MKPAISICIPVYNVERYIESCIKSVQSQTFQDFEIIVVNDCTPDDSMRIVEAMAELDNRIKIYTNDRNMGLMWTRREGYRHATGDFIVFLDSDDSLPVDSLSHLYEAITSTNADIVSGQIAYITAQETSLDKYPNILLYGETSRDIMKSTLRWEITHNLCGKIYKKELFDKYDYVTYENVTNAEDALLFYQLICNIKRYKTIGTVVYNYYLYDDSSTNVVLNEKALNGIFLWQKLRWDIIYNTFPHLINDLKKSMIIYLTTLAPSLPSRKIINQNLTKYGIPFKVSLSSIVCYSNSNTVLKSVVSYFFAQLVRKIRFRRIRGRAN